MLQYWLDTNVLPSWNEIVEALESTYQLVLAPEVKHEYLWSDRFVIRKVCLIDYCHEI